MAVTPVLGIRTPELSELADLPKALSDLALDLEDARSINRGWVRANGQGMVGNDSGTVANPGETKQIMPAQTIAPVVNGWAEITFGCHLFQASGTGPGTWAGTLKMYVNGLLCGESRFHNHGLTQTMFSPVESVVQVPLSMPTMVFGVNMGIDTPANVGVRAIEWELNVRQYGAGRA